MKIRTIVTTFLLALLIIPGCGEDRQAERKEEKQSAEEAEREFMRKLAERPVTPPDYVGPEPKWWWLNLDSPPDYVGPEPKWWWLNPDSPPEYVGPVPAWWRKAPVPPDCVGLLVEKKSEQPAEPVKKVKKKPAAKKTVARKTPSVSPKKGSRKPKAQVEREFESFAKNFLDKMSRNLRHSVRNKEVVKSGSGYVARFIHLDKDTLSMEVKPCEGPASYVGVMRYLEDHYENECGTEDCAKDGPFTLVKKVRFTEIFRYAGGRWHE
jgi:hypothetical protein